MVSYPDFCYNYGALGSLGPLTFLAVALILLIVKTHATVYNHIHTTCAQYIMNAHMFGARAMR